jgi:hypothetical protein
MRPPNAPEENHAFPTRLGNFDIEVSAEGKPRLLGKGTYGETYLARHCFLESPAAIKVINEQFLSQSKARERFLAEAKAVARLRHPHIAQMYDFGVIQNGLFYAMEFCGGGNLAEWLRKNGSMPPRQLVAVAQQVASALKCCHAEGFIHRDLKPANLMLASADGSLVVKLIDFGLVQEKREDEDGSHRIGTPLYASPEQLKQQDVDARSDLFSLGMTLWQLATGRAPDSGSPAEVIIRRLAPGSYAGQLPPELPDQLRALIESLVEKDRLRRPASAAQVLDMLNDAAVPIGAPIFTDLVGAPDSATARPAAGSAAGSAAVEPFPGSIEGDFQMTQILGDSASGRTYLATHITSGDGRVLLHVLDAKVRANPKLLDLVRRNVGQLAALKLPSVLAAGAIRAYADFTAILLPAPRGPDLLTALKERGKVPIAEARMLLETIAATSDRLTAAGLPGVELGAGQMFIPAGSGAAAADWKPMLMPRFLAQHDRVQAGEAFLSVEGEADATMTPDELTEASPDDLPGIFARLLYRITAGRESPAAAAISMQGYVAIPELSEDSNRTLAQVIGNVTGYTACEPLLGRVLGLEGMGGTSTSQPHVKTGTRGTAATGTLPAFPRTAAPGTQTAAPVTPIAPLRPRTATAPPPGKNRALIFALVAILIAAGGVGVWWWTNRPQKPEPKPVPIGEIPVNPDARVTGTSGERLPAGAIMRLKAPDLPGTPKFTANGVVLAFKRTADGWELTIPNGGAPLPYEIVGEVAGFLPEKIRIDSARDLLKPIDFFPKMEKGRLIFIADRCDYTEIGARMLRPLSGAAGPDQVPRALAFPIESHGLVAADLPPGIYRLTLRNEQGDAERLWEKEVEIRAGSELSFTLPPSLAGAYSGTLDVAGSAVPGGAKLNCRLTVEPNLGGTFIEGGRRCALEKGRLDAEGNLRVQLRWSRVEEGTQGYPWLLIAKREAGATVSIEITETRETESGLEAALEAKLARPPFGALQWKAAGTMKVSQ